MLSNRQATWKTRAGSVAAILTAVMTSGCSSWPLVKQSSTVAESEQGDRKLVSIQQSKTQRDMVTGDRRFVFCEGAECTAPTQKSQAQPIRRIVVPAKSSASNAVDAEQTKVFKLGFDYDRSTLNAEGIKVLEEAAAYSVEKKASEIRIHGKADSLNRDTYNLKLAQRRARTAERFLKSKKLEAKMVVDASIVRVTADGVYPPGETMNGRRVDLDIEIIPTTK